MTAFGRVAKRLAGCVRATSTVELALISPILAMVLAGSVDCARLVSAKLLLQQAAERTAELATAGNIGSAAFTSLQSEAATAANVPTANVTVSYWLECDGVRQSLFNGTCATGQQVGRFASVSITSSYRPSFAWLLHSVGSDSGIPISAGASVRVQ